MVKVLEGLRVLEMGTFITGPAAAMFLADMGADVVKVEQPKTGDPFRAFEGGLYSPHFQTYNRNKRSLTLDTREAVDLRIFDALAADADVFIQNFRPGTAEKLSVGVERLQKLNPALVYCGISGFGHDGPDRERPAYDTVAQAASGWLRLLINPENPRVVGPAIADAVTGMYAAFGILGALIERQKTGKGRRIDISMLEAMCHFNLDDFTHFFSRGEVMGPYSRPSVSQSYVFECADGKWIALHMSSPPKFWQGLANAIERPTLFEDPRFADRPARIKHQNDLITLMTPIFKSKPREEWCARLEGEGVPYAPVYDSSEALQDRQAKHLGIQVEAEHPTMGKFRSVRFPVNFDGQRLSTITAPPTLGEHDEAIRSLAGQIWSARSANAAE
ncbi:MAG TPA: CoA transferase [Rhizomicrobium sp.]|jgi:crotonobetainyl-CoA:carnitine CoA-transferase CaiB-like acyl-CoA transferase